MRRPSLSAARPRRRGLSPAGLVAAAVLFGLADYGDTQAHTTVLIGLCDETAHVLTTLLVLWAIGGVLYDRLLIPAIVASVAIDLDHIPAELGDDFWTRGTPRPYTHSLATIVVVLAVAAVWRRRREVLIAVAVGLAIHFWRDMAEPGSGVALMWPLSDASWSLSQLSYLIVMAGAVAFGLARSLRLVERRRAGGPVAVGVDVAE
jgi:inner membrane protein